MWLGCHGHWSQRLGDPGSELAYRGEWVARLAPVGAIQGRVHHRRPSLAQALLYSVAAVADGVHGTLDDIQLILAARDKTWSMGGSRVEAD
jgi:hypothetical protein